ncbi:MAG: hypothetical protein IT162_14570 [Bryobacterales bacterium]|nr:hypothetical protein [Bryobacterales bacterium]
MKLDVDSARRLAAWMHAPRPAVFQGLDLRAVSVDMARLPLAGCVFLGCRMENTLAEAAADACCLLMPAVDGLPFDPFTPGLYSPAELFDRFDPARPAESYRECRDYLIYESYLDPATHHPRPVDVDVMLLRRLHDASISGALEDLLDHSARLRAVAIMGGHDRLRTDPVFAAIARLGLTLAQRGYLLMTGGGPGLMEAANLGAYCAGFGGAAPQVLAAALETMSAAPSYKDEGWMAAAWRAWKAMGDPPEPERAASVGIPTWFYGHEPPNLFATHIAKYFENSVREEGLLAAALAGVIFAPGNGGTVQEIFQDACQNYYRTYARVKSPMILLGTEYWNPAAVDYSPGVAVRNKPAYPLLRKLAAEKGFEDYLLLTDDASAIPAFLDAHPPSAA